MPGFRGFVIDLCVNCYSQNYNRIVCLITDAGPYLLIFNKLNRADGFLITFISGLELF